MEINVKFDSLAEIDEFCKRMMAGGVAVQAAATTTAASSGPDIPPAAEPTKPKATRGKKETPPAAEPAAEAAPPAEKEAPPAEPSAETGEKVWTLEEIREMVQNKMKTVTDGTTKLKEALSRCGASSLSQNGALDPALYGKFVALVEEIK